MNLPKILILISLSLSGVLGLRWQGPAGYYRRLLDLPSICPELQNVNLFIYLFIQYPPSILTYLPLLRHFATLHLPPHLPRLPLVRPLQPVHRPRLERGGGGEGAAASQDWQHFPHCHRSSLILTADQKLVVLEKKK